MDKLQSQVLEASISDPNDPFETTMVGTAASVGTTSELFGSGKRVKWTAEQLEEYAPSLKDMPVTLEIYEDEEGRKKFVPHSKTVIGRIKDVYFDKTKNAVAYTAALHKHLFPDTIEELAKLKASDEAEVSWEFYPTGLTDLPDEGDNVVTPSGGRFGALAVVNKGADLGNSIALLASAVERETAKIADNQKSNPKAGSFEWIGNQIVQHLTAQATPDTHVPFEVIETYPDHSVFIESGRYFDLPYTIKGNEIDFSDTIEVEPVYQPLGASASGSIQIPDGTPPPKVEETDKNTMAEINETELAALRASAEKAPTLETENADLKAELETLKAAKQELDDLKAENAKKEEEARLDTLAASRLEEVEKIVPYKDEKQKAEDKEAFKTMDEKSFDIVKRTLMAAAEVRGGVANEARIDPPDTREDPDGAAKDILESEEYKALKAAYAPDTKEGK